MLNCYLLALSRLSSIDRGSNNISIYQLVESAQIAPDESGRYPGELPLEVHAYWMCNGDPTGKAFEFRVVRMCGEQVDAGPPIALAMEHRRQRVRTGMFKVPPTEGEWVISVQWREKGSETWHSSPAAWPFTLLKLTAAPPPSLPPGNEIPGVGATAQ